MYILKRSLYYITRKKGKSITIGVILFVVATLVLTGLLISDAANKTFKQAKNKLGSNVIYKSDTSSVIEDAMNNSSNGQENKRNFNPGELSLPEDYTNLTTKEVETIVKNSKYVKSYKYSTSYTGNPVDFEEYSLTSSDSDSENENNSQTDANMPNDKHMDMASLSITGVSEESDVINSTNNLSDGTFFTESQITNGENVIMIEKKLAELNGLSVGDTISIEKVEMKRGKNDSSDNTSINTTYTIVGIYESSNSTELSDNNFGMSMNNVENAMYVPYTSILKMQENGLSEDEINDLQEKGYIIERVTFIIDDPDNSDAFIKEVENMKDIDLTYRSLSIDNEAYEKMVGNIESVASTAKILVMVVIVAGVAIIMLLSMLTIKDRKYEIGVLLSLGESKIKVLFQLISEVLIIGVIAFTLSTAATSLFAQKVTNHLLNNEISSVNVIGSEHEEGIDNNVSKGNEPARNDQGGRMGKFNMNRPDTNSLDVETINELTVSLTPLSVLALYGVGLLIIVIGNIVQGIFVLKLNPKEIMLDR